MYKERWWQSFNFISIASATVGTLLFLVGFIFFITWLRHMSIDEWQKYQDKDINGIHCIINNDTNDLFCSLPANISQIK